MLASLAATAALLTTLVTSTPIYSPLDRAEILKANLVARQVKSGASSASGGSAANAPAPAPTANGAITTGSANKTWSWTSGEPLHGISLGNWLVLERWMDEEWFIESCGDPNARDEWTWSQALGSRAQSVLKDHWESWITDDDIKFIAESGFNHLRIPIGYWAWISEPAGTPYVSQGGQVEQLTRVLQSAYNYGLYVIIDLHGLPGSQNGEQPSGHIGYNNFYQPQNQEYGDATVDAIIAYVEASPYRSIITAYAAVNEPVYYTQDQYETLVQYYERTYAKLQAMTNPLPMMFSPGRPETSPRALWQGFVNGKNPNYLIYEDHPYVGRLAPLQSQSSLLSQVCQKAKQYAGFSIPVAITEWSVSTAIWDDAQWNGEFYAAQIRAWAQSGGGVFWSYRVNAYTEKFNQTENFTLYSFVDLARLGQIPLPTNNQTSAEYLASFPGTCNFDAPRDTYASSIASAPVTVTNAFTKRAFGSAAEPTPAPL